MFSKMTETLWIRLPFFALYVLVFVAPDFCRTDYIRRVDAFALLSGTLRTYQQAGCDDDVVTLKCPHGTSISIQIAQYGKQALSKALCPKSTSQTGLVKMPYNDTCLWPNALQTKWDEVAQGTWGRTVVEACQKKRQCKFQASPKTFGGDPCPGVRKYVEVAYKCRPYEFRSKIACENDVIHLKCNPYSRIAVYSASYGRTEYESVQCPQLQGVPEETCLVSYATETVMQICHGKRRCTISADAATFGNPCRPESQMYLKVVFTCVPLKVLREQYEVPPDTDERGSVGHEEGNDDEDDFDGYDTGDEFIRESAASPASPPSPNVDGTQGDNNLTKDSPDSSTRTPPHARAKGTMSADAAVDKASSYTSPRPRYNLIRPSRPPAAQQTTKDIQADDITGEKMLDNANCTVSVYTKEKTRVIGFITEWINAYTFVSQNQERFYLYLILSVTAGIVLCLGLVIGQLLLQRHRSRREAKFHATNVAENALPNGFTDDISEIDADIDLTTPLPVPTVAIHPPPRHEQVSSIAEVVRYGGSVGIPMSPGMSTVPTHGRRPQDCESAVPRSLNRAGNSQYYYG